MGGLGVSYHTMGNLKKALDYYNDSLKICNEIGYKKGIVLGLLTMAVGCLLFYPAASYREYSIFMIAYFVLAGGMTVLQVAANPYVAALGSEEGASSRLNLSQAFNSLGTAIAPAIGAMFILSDKVKSSDEIAALSAILPKITLIFLRESSMSLI